MNERTSAFKKAGMRSARLVLARWAYHADLRQLE